MEPWDGPAAIAGTDNEWVIAANDRNGLRPLRYAITKDKLLFAGSETGMIELNEKRESVNIIPSVLPFGLLPFYPVSNFPLISTWSM